MPDFYKKLTEIYVQLPGHPVETEVSQVNWMKGEKAEITL